MFVLTKQTVTDLAKDMRREAAGLGLAVGHSASLDRAARALGFRDFNGLVADLRTGPLGVELQHGSDPLTDLLLGREPSMEQATAQLTRGVIGLPEKQRASDPGLLARHLHAALFGTEAVRRRVRTDLAAMAEAWFGTAPRHASEAQRVAWARAFHTVVVEAGDVLAAKSRPEHHMAFAAANGPLWAVNWGALPDRIGKALRGETLPSFPIPAAVPMSVSATIRTDDGTHEAEWNASGYFEQASDEELWELSGIDFRGDYAADAVAWHVHGEPGFEAVSAVLDYDQEVARCGFEVVVDPKQAMAWIAANRPTLHASLTADDEAAPAP